MFKIGKLRASVLATILAIPLAGGAAWMLPVEANAQAQSGGWRKEVAEKVKSAQEA